jgi:hypothetical protein
MNRHIKTTICIINPCLSSSNVGSGWMSILSLILFISDTMRVLVGILIAKMVVSKDMIFEVNPFMNSLSLILAI